MLSYTRCIITATFKKKCQATKFLIQNVEELLSNKKQLYKQTEFKTSAPKWLQNYLFFGKSCICKYKIIM